MTLTSRFFSRDRHPVTVMVIFSSLILLACSSLKHFLYQSTAFDLGIFDQAIYLISVGLPPIDSFNQVHILGDHAAFIFYPLAILYKLYPTVYWLFFIQAIFLALGALPCYKLSQEAQLSIPQSQAIALVYLLYPLIFNVNLFDFHPEVIATPFFLWAIVFVREKQLGKFIISLLIILSCKAVLALTVAFLGLWLILFEKQKRYGLIALGSGIGWFLITTQLIIPHFRGREAAAVARYSFLGNSVLEIVENLFFKPQIILSHLFTGSNLGYTLLLVIPLAWGLGIKHWGALIPAIPTFFLNILADYDSQKDLLHQYSLPILPFLIVVIISNLATGQTWLRRPRWIIIWSLVCFFALAKIEYFPQRYFSSWDTWQATNQAIAEIKTQGGVLTSAEIAPHLTHRPLVKLAINGSENLDFDQFEYVLLNGRHPGWESSPQLIATLIQKLKANNNFQPLYQQDDVLLLQKKPILNALNDGEAAID